jgi:hypothetical protein
MAESVAEQFLVESQKSLRRYKRLAEDAIAQLADGELFVAPGEESNSIAVIVKHVGGNLRSRWTDFLNSDGEKPDRNRDAEFEAAPGTSRSEVMHWWEDGWACAFEALDALSADDLRRTVTIRGEPHSVPEAIVRSVTHCAYHVGQIVYLAKQLRSREWRSLSIPRGQSLTYNAVVAEGRATQRSETPGRVVPR